MVVDSMAIAVVAAIAILIRLLNACPRMKVYGPGINPRSLHDDRAVIHVHAARIADFSRLLDADRNLDLDPEWQLSIDPRPVGQREVHVARTRVLVRSLVDEGHRAPVLDLDPRRGEAIVVGLDRDPRCSGI